MDESRFRGPAGGVSPLGLHLVWCPRGRRRLLGGRVAVRLGGLLEQIGAENGWEIVAREVVADHVHLCVRVGPVDAPARVVRRFEARTARVLRRECAWPADSTVLWSPSYMVAPGGYGSAATVRRYIEHRWVRPRETLVQVSDAPDEPSAHRAARVCRVASGAVQRGVAGTPGCVAAQQDARQLR